MNGKGYPPTYYRHYATTYRAAPMYLRSHPNWQLTQKSETPLAFFLNHSNHVLDQATKTQSP